MAIKWIGYNKFTKEEGRAWPDSVMPIRVARFAIDGRSPHSNLYLSPLHCVFFNEALIPIKYLVNGTSLGIPSCYLRKKYLLRNFLGPSLCGRWASRWVGFGPPSLRRHTKI